VFVLYQHKNGKLGGIGIEVKYTEVGYPLKKGSKEEGDVKRGENDKYINITRECGYYLEEIAHKPLPDSPLISNDFRQIWRNHILGASMLNNENIKYPLCHFNSVLLYPSKNEHFVHVIVRAKPKYEDFLTEYGKESFCGITYEDFFDILSVHYTSADFPQWISYLKSRYIF